MEDVNASRLEDIAGQQRKGGGGRRSHDEGVVFNGEQSMSEDVFQRRKEPAYGTKTFIIHIQVRESTDYMTDM